MTKEELQQEIKALIVSSLGLEDITPDEIETDAPLFVDGLGLDSIDALELGLAVKKKYGITMSAESEENKKHFASVAALADFIAAETARAS
jgi:acyl carrier protein